MYIVLYLSTNVKDAVGIIIKGKLPVFNGCKTDAGVFRKFSDDHVRSTPSHDHLYVFLNLEVLYTVPVQLHQRTHGNKSGGRHAHYEHLCIDH